MQYAIIDLITAYYAFDIAYPSGISGILLFIQHNVLGMKDSQPLPPGTLRLVNSWSKLP